MKKRVKWKFVPDKLEESTEWLDNPGRGWYEIHTFRAGEPCPEWELCPPDTPLADLPAGRNGPDSMVLLLFQLEAGEEVLRQQELQKFDQVLSAYAGKRDIILRFVYDVEGRGMECEPGEFRQVMEHLLQLAPLLRKYAPFLYLYQGMLVGSWGELHTSKFVTGRHLREMGRCLMEIADGNFFLAVRRPSQWRQLFARGQGQVDGQNSGVGLFNDGILGSETDLGTYGAESASCEEWEAPWSLVDELVFQKSLCRHVPNGGEAVYGQNGGQLSLEQIVDRLSHMHVSYLNCRHDENALAYWQALKWKKRDAWNGVNGYEYIGCHMGYRFVVRRAEMLKKRGEEEAELRVEIENVGFSSMYESAELFLIYEDIAGQRYEEGLPCDVKRWESGETISVSCRVLPRAGQYYLSLRRKKDGRPVLFANRNQTSGKSYVCLGKIL